MSLKQPSLRAEPQTIALGASHNPNKGKPISDEAMMTHWRDVSLRGPQEGCSVINPETTKVCEELRMSARAVGRFYATWQQWDSYNPCPVHPTHGQARCPNIAIYEVIEEEKAWLPVEQGAAVHVQHALVHAAAPWEPKDHPENRQAMAMAQYICASVNRMQALLIANATGKPA